MADPRWGPVERHPQIAETRPRRAQGDPPPSSGDSRGRVRSWLAWIGITLGALVLLGIVGATATLLMGYATTTASLMVFGISSKLSGCRFWIAKLPSWDLPSL